MLFFNQSGPKSNRDLAYARFFSRAWRGLHVLCSRSDWFIAMLRLARVITVIQKPLSKTN